MAEKCPGCGMWWRTGTHACPPISVTTGTLHHIERPEDYLDARLLRFLADEKAEEAGRHCATCRCGEG